MVKIVSQLTFIFLFAGILLLTGCNNTSSEQSNDFISEDSNTMNTEISEFDIDNAEKSSKQSEATLEYDIKVDLLAASDRFSLTTLSIPLKYNNRNLNILYLLDKNKLLCGLSDNESIHEIGIWKLDTSEYIKLIDVNAGEWYVVAADSDNIFLEYLSDFNDMGMSKIAQLWKYSWQNEKFEKIFSYSQNSDGYNGAVFSNHRLLYDGYLYFEDLLQNEEQLWIGKAYRYSIENGQIEFLGDNLQNPLLMNGAVWYIQINSDSYQHHIKNITSGEIIKLPENIFDIVSTGKDIVVSYAVGENTKNGLTITGLKRVDSTDDIFTAECNIEQLQANLYFTVWTSMSDNYPVLYDNIHNQMLYLESMDKANHYYWLKDNYGLIMSLIFNLNGTMEQKYTFFALNE